MTNLHTVSFYISYVNIFFSDSLPSTSGLHLLNPRNPFYVPSTLVGNQLSSGYSTASGLYNNSDSKSNDRSESESDFHDTIETIDDNDLETSEQRMYKLY